MNETVKKGIYARPQLKVYGGVKQLTQLSKNTNIPTDGSFISFDDSKLPAGSCNCT